MNITELDEFQGLTAEMVREWLLANQWEPCGSSAAHLYYQCGSGEISEALLHDDLGWVVDLLAQSYERSVQSILREINPRMRPWPSRQARSAHDGLWMVVVSDDETGAIGRFRNDVPWFSFNEDANGDGNILSEEDSFALYWPCDAKGNKVRWPEKDGVML